MGPRVRVVGVGRAGGSFERALAAAGWDVAPGVGRDGPIATAATDVDLVLITTPDAAVAEVAARIEPVDTAVVAHASGVLGPEPIAHHPRYAVIHPLVALPDPERGAARLVGAWYGLAVGADPIGERVVADLQGWAVHIEPGDWVPYHAAAVIAANHLVALLGQAERVATGVGLPLAALMDLAAGSLADVADLGPARALTGPVRRGDLETVERHLAALPADEREAYRVMSEQAARLVAGPEPTSVHRSVSRAHTTRSTIPTPPSAESLVDPGARMNSSSDPHRTVTRRLRSLVARDPESGGGLLELSLETIDIPEPHDDQVLIRIEAAPINPSDLGMLLAGADVSVARADGAPDAPVVTAPIGPGAMKGLGGRIGRSMPVGNEGAGVVVATGAADQARALLGATVAVLGGGMYAGYRCVPAAQCLRLPDGVTAVQGASCFVNPLTALGMVGTMRLEHHRALVHTAAASNLGQMLNRLCLVDRIGLVNIVRRDEHVELLRSQGAAHVLNSTSPDFDDELTEALVATGATLAFDAIGGGDLAGRILAAMERAAARASDGYDRYGSSVHKQVYVYGGLDRRPTVIDRTFGMAWSIGGWLLLPFLARVGPEEAQRLRERVAAEITSTFASSYTDEITLAEALDVETLRSYARQATGQKYLVRPQL